LSEAGTLFTGVYALYAGLVFIALIGIILAPFIHRVLHR
jgi:tetrahydromethanopterin S-methyltransferase subunit B